MWRGRWTGSILPGWSARAGSPARGAASSRSTSRMRCPSPTCPTRTCCWSTCRTGDEGPGERYLLPAYVSRAGHVWEPRTGEGFWEALMRALRAGGELPGVHGLFELRPTPLLAQEPAMAGERALAVDQSNTSVILGERVVLKAYRLLCAGRAPRGRARPRARARRLPGRARLRGLAAPHRRGRPRDGARDRPAVRARLDRPWEWKARQIGRLIAGVEPCDIDAATDDVAEIGRIARRAARRARARARDAAGDRAGSRSAGGPPPTGSSTSRS